MLRGARDRHYIPKDTGLGYGVQYPDLHGESHQEQRSVDFTEYH